MASNFPHLNDIERLSPRVIRILGGNPSKFTLQGTNTYLIGTGRQRILLDTGQGEPAWLTSLKTTLDDEKCKISICLLSHWHPDHISGVPDLQSVAPDVKTHKKSLPSRDAPDQGWSEIEHGQKFQTEGATLRAVHSPGHTEDHMAFVLEEEGAMFTADNVLGHGTAVFEDLKVYLESLERMKSEDGFIGRAYPGHGEVLSDGRAKIGEYIAHRKQREKEVVGVLQDNGDKSSMEIVKVVYKDVPESLHGPAEGGVVQVLKKLEVEGKVSRSGDKWRLSEGSNL